LKNDRPTLSDLAHAAFDAGLTQAGIVKKTPQAQKKAGIRAKPALFLVVGNVPLFGPYSYIAYSFSRSLRRDFELFWSVEARLFCPL